MTNVPKPEPILILPDAEYRRAFVAPPPPPPGRPRRKGWAAALLAAGFVGAARYAFVLIATAPVPAPVTMRPASPPAPPPAQVRTPLPLVPETVPDLEPEAAPEPGVPVPAPPAPAPAPWMGGRAWVEVRVRVEHRAFVQETTHRVTVAWDGTRFALERPATGSSDPGLQRVGLLFDIPDPEAPWTRKSAEAGRETLRVGSTDLDCRIVEGEDRFPQGSRCFRYWHSDAFPAGALQARLMFSDTTLSGRVLGFGPAGKP